MPSESREQPISTTVDHPEQLPFSAKLVVLAIALVGALPIALRRLIGRALGRAFAALPSRERAIAELQLRAFLPQANPAKVVPQMFAGLGETILEGFNLAPLIADHQRTIRCQQPELFEWAITQGRPILGLTAHTGNWELFAAYLHARGARSIAIGRPARNATLHQALAYQRECAGIRVIWRSGRGGMQEILQAFEKGYIIGALLDQDTRVRSIPVPFLGTPAQTPVTLVEIAKKHNALFFAAFIIRETSGSYCLHVTKLDEQGSAEQILEGYHHALEALLREHPEQWMWFHKRWRTLPSGERRAGKAYLEYLKGVAADGSHSS